MSMASVGNFLAKELPLSDTSEFTLEKGLMNVGNVAKPLGTNPNLINVRELTLGKGPLSVLNVGNSSGRAKVLLNTREPIPAQDLMGAASAESPLGGGLPLLSIRAVTLGSSLIPVVNVGNPSVEAAALPNIAELILGKGRMSVTSVESHLGKSVLIQHQVHTEGRPYKCTKCGKSFSQHSNFFQHQKWHGMGNTQEGSKYGKFLNTVSNIAPESPHFRKALEQQVM